MIANRMVLEDGVAVIEEAEHHRKPIESRTMEYQKSHLSKYAGQASHRT